MVAQDRKNFEFSPYFRVNLLYPRIYGCAGTVRREPVIPGHDAEVNVAFRDNFRHHLRKAIHAINMKVCQMENPEPVKSLWQVPESQFDAANLGLQGISQPSPVQARPHKRRLKKRTNQSIMP
jgi:hypothetical protein